MKRFFLLLFAIVSCSHKQPTPTADLSLAEQPGYEGLLFLNITGTNSFARFAKNGHLLLFVSADRMAHRQKQVYSYDIDALKEKRLTYQDGNTAYPLLTQTNDGEDLLIYSSTTDEIKDFNQVIQQKLKPNKIAPVYGVETDILLNHELYSSFLDGSHITRLTNESHFDGHPQLATQPSSILFSTMRQHGTKLASLNLKTKEVKILTNGNGHDLYLSPPRKLTSAGPENSKKTRYLFVRYQPNFLHGDVYTTDETFSSPRKVELPSGQYMNPVFIDDDHALVSYRQNSKDSFQVHQFSLKTNCSKALVQSPGHQVFVDVSVERNKLVFALIEKEQSRLVYISLPNVLPCP